MARLVERRAVVAVLARPRLWAPAVTFILRSSPAGWWRRWPPVPSPSAAYAAYRLHTAHGAEEAPLDAREVVDFLEWSRRMSRFSR